VCFIDGAWPADTWMGQVAAELNLPMTAYLRPLLAHDDAEWHLRWFLPVGREQDICGHATLAAAHALFSEGRAAGTVRFSTRSGVLVAHACEDGSVTLEFPAAALEEGSAPAGLREALGVDIDAAYTTGELGDLLCVVRDEAAVRAADPDFAALTGVTRRQGMRGVILTAASSDPGGGVDYVSRCFYPRDGLPEDSVTGSAHTALAPYWSRRLGRDPLVGLQASARTGVVRTSIHGDRVHLTGRAVSLVDGTLHAREREAVATRDSVVAARNAG
jgi:PhzF family phenazine biosynthesis protein